AWSSLNADVASSTVTMSPTVDACGNAQGGPWVANTTSGSTCKNTPPYSRRVANTQAYTVTESSTGRTPSAHMLLIINTLGPALIITSFTANRLSSTPSLHDALPIYAWSSLNADVASSTVTMSPTLDACGNTQGGPWVANTTSG